MKPPKTHHVPAGRYHTACGLNTRNERITVEVVGHLDTITCQRCRVTLRLAAPSKGARPKTTGRFSTRTELVGEILGMASIHMTADAIARRVGVSTGTVYIIINHPERR